jgi:hypothetical protein
MTLVWANHHYGFSCGFLLYLQKQWLTIAKRAPLKGGEFRGGNRDLPTMRTVST